MRVQLATERDARREIARERRRRSYSGTGFGPRSFECLGISNNIGIDIGAGSVTVIVPVQWATFFPGAYQVVQTDLGLTYGGTPAATAGNTSTTVLTLTGALPTTPIPIWWKSTNSLSIGSGATFNIYYDGTGAAPAMTGVTPTAGTPIALTGAATGLSTAWAAGTSVTNNTWKATCSALADQSGNGLNYSQATASKQPVIGVGFNGKASITTNGISAGTQCLVSSLNTPAPGTQSYTILIVARTLSQAYAYNACLVSSNPTVNGANIELTASTGFRIYNGNVVSNGTNTAAALSRFRAYLSNSASDALKVGSAVDVTGASAGNAAVAGRGIGANGGAINGISAEIMAVIYVPGQLTAGQLSAFDAACNSAAGYGVGSVAV